MPIDDAKLAAQYKFLAHGGRFRFFTMLALPAAAFVGLRLDHLGDDACIASLPGGWRTQNPFRTMYWAAQGMAAELATGAPPFAMSRAIPENLRMFVIGVEGSFVKRAKGRITFTCDELQKARQAIEETQSSGESVNCDLEAVGRDTSGEVVSRWVFKWNFRALDVA